jgi:hypothetical protein
MIRCAGTHTPDSGGDDTFDAARIAREELARVCDEIASSVQASQSSRFSRRKARAEQKVSDQLRAAIGGGGDENVALDVREVVDAVEETWKARHGRVRSSCFPTAARASRGEQVLTAVDCRSTRTFSACVPVCMPMSESSPSSHRRPCTHRSSLEVWPVSCR